MNREPFRLDPKLPASHRKTYAIRRPKATHWRPASCAEVGCAHYLNGWRVSALVVTEQHLADLKAGGWRWSVLDIAENERWLVFEAGQPCFRAKTHQVPAGRPPLYVVQDGDWRGNPRGTKPYVHSRPDDWVDDFGEHQQKLADRIKEG